MSTEHDEALMRRFIERGWTIAKLAKRLGAVRAKMRVFRHDRDATAGVLRLARSRYIQTLRRDLETAILRGVRLQGEVAALAAERDVLLAENTRLRGNSASASFSRATVTVSESGSDRTAELSI